jgi:beta-galactosidase
VLAAIGRQPLARAPVARVFSHEAAWVLGIQPQGQSFCCLQLVFEACSALRAKGLEVDIVAPEADLAGDRVVVVPSLPAVLR